MSNCGENLKCELKNNSEKKYDDACGHVIIEKTELC